jgi:nitrogen-specific signal transduction histidine kinase
VGNTARVDVEDNGPGLPSPDAPVLDAFFTTKPESTGLGLAIVRRVAFDLGGSVTHARHGDRTIFSLHLLSCSAPRCSSRTKRLEERDDVRDLVG